MKRWSCLVSLMFAAACMPVLWNREEVKPKQLNRRQHVKIWSGDTVLRWHAVVITGDSVTGVPTKMSSKCNSCRVGLPRNAVDSIRSRDPASPRESVVLTVLLLTYSVGHLSRGDPR